jgi:hypothetical protein
LASFGVKLFFLSQIGGQISHFLPKFCVFKKSLYFLSLLFLRQEKGANKNFRS